MDLIEIKKVLLFVDVCDESVEDICLIFEFWVKMVELDVLMESLFWICDLEFCFSFNMNVLYKGVL